MKEVIAQVADELISHFHEIVRCANCSKRGHECPMRFTVGDITADQTEDNGFCFLGEMEGESR